MEAFLGVSMETVIEVNAEI